MPSPNGPFSAAVKTLVYEATHPATAVWGTRTALGIAPEGVAMPYLMFLLIFGDAERETSNPDALYTINIRCIAQTVEQAMQGYDEINERFDEKGSQEKKGPFLLATNWEIVYCIGGRDIHFPEIVAGGAGNIQHMGRDYYLKMYRR
jgi:hypothetical protein